MIMPDDTTLGKAIDAIIVSNASAAVEEFCETASHRILNPLLEWLNENDFPKDSGLSGHSI